MRILEIPYKDTDDFYSKYLSLYQGELKLTDTEIRIMLYLIISLLEFKKQYPKHNVFFLNKEVFSKSEIIKLCEETGLSINQYHNIKNALLEKKALFKVKDNLLINQLLVPQSSIGFKFKQIEDEQE